MTSQIFISAERAGLSDGENRDRTNHLKESLQRVGYSVVQVEGSYKGTKERSLKIILPINPELGMGLGYLKTIAAVFQQESILRVSSTGDAELLFIKTGEHEKIGKLITSVKLPEGVENWTKIPYMSGHYFLYSQKEFK